MGDLSEHFDVGEFRSKDGVSFPPEVLAQLWNTAQMLERLRTALGDRLGREVALIVTPNGGYRSPAQNAKSGGVPGSLHTKGMAADVVCQHAGPKVVQEVALVLQAAGIVGGVGQYDGFTHVDIGPRRKWDERTREALGAGIAGP